MPSETMRMLRSTIRDDGTIAVTIIEEPTPELSDDQLLVEVGASPINPSDLGTLLAGIDPESLHTGNVDGRPALVANLLPGVATAQAARVGLAMPVGNEGAGTVVATGAGSDAQALLGRTVAAIPGGMYATHRVVHHSQALPLPEGVTAEQGASCFVNPLTVLGMIETMRLDGHSGIVHTAAASNLGQMLVKACNSENVPLVNVVRRSEQADLLRSLGAEHVVVSSDDSFRADLVEALTSTGATIAFDAIGGGDTLSSILSAMERAAGENDPANRYGSTVLKQGYIYGGLDSGPTVLDRTYGMAWSIGGFLMPNFLARVGDARASELRAKVADEITTTFASSYTDRISLDQVIDPEVTRRYARMATGEKYLVVP
ncbi:MAG: zinc-binding dehydrogenase [Ilumatobacteraceae bacterium]|nr:zinc-binding dehydrogenase [Ilumatobacteraceae bacterium]